MSHQINFPLSAEQCQLLIVLDASRSVAEMASRLGRDTSVISRQLSRLAQTAPVIEKRDGRWQLTKAGEDLVIWSHQAIIDQKRILNRKRNLRLVTTREFSARVLAPRLKQLTELLGQSQITLLASEFGIENYILDGKADFGIDCGRPTDPGIKFQRVLPEQFVIVVGNDFLGKQTIGGLEDLIRLPYLRYNRITPERYLALPKSLGQPYAIFNDMASQREAIVHNLGWAVMPEYVVSREIRLGLLKSLDICPIPDDHFGIWYLRSRHNMKPQAEKLTEWLSNLDLQQIN